MPPAQSPFARAAVEAVASITGVPAADLKVEAPPRPELGDFAVGCFAAAKAMRRSPADVAKQVATVFVPGPLLASATAAGPFVNFRADRAAAFRWLFEQTLAGGSLVPPAEAGETICIDYSSPNISKHLAYHHIRSTTIGHALANLHRALGARVAGINHLGDWGTTHGMIIAAYKRWGADEPLDITKINELYKRFRGSMKDDPTLEPEGRAWFKKLEDGDPEARALWTRFRDISLAEFQSAYDTLGIEFDEIRGESAYEPDLPGVIELVKQKGLLVTSEGAQVVELPDEKTPILLIKEDGATLYATRDVAAAMYRWNTYHFTRSLYVVDRGQAMHFRQLFKLLALLGFEWSARCEHVPFGVVRFGGTKTSSREGTVLLKDVFAEATGEVRPRIRQANPSMPGAEVERTATMVGVGAVVFANLVPQRDKDVDFDLDKALSVTGDSGPYLQYSHARCEAVVRKAGARVELAAATPVADALVHDAEWAVARRLLDFGEIVARAAAGSEPHILCHYLLDLAGDFSRWYTGGNEDASLRMLVDETTLRTARLALVQAVQAALREGLGILGLGAPDVM
jgi:arginyl-tRNA synthetase